MRESKRVSHLYRLEKSVVFHNPQIKLRLTFSVSKQTEIF